MVDEAGSVIDIFLRKVEHNTLGYAGKVLSVDLSSKTLSHLFLPEEWYEEFLGGTGLAVCQLLKEHPADLAEINPVDGPLMFFTGPLAGTGIPGTDRLVAAGISPYTSIWGESSCGGRFASTLKSCGFDGIVIRGRSTESLYLEISKDGISLLPAAHLVDRDCYERVDALSSGGKFSTLVTGPAASNGVLYSSICHDKAHFCGRTGLGFLMASKGLLGIAARGWMEPVHREPERLAQIRARIREKLSHSLLAQALGEFGTNSSMDIGLMLGDVPIRNWRMGEWAGASNINGPAFSESVLVKRGTCRSCPVACKRVVKLPGAEHTQPGPEYETCAAFGTMCLVDDVEWLCTVNDICNRYGMDTISAGCTIALAIDLFERGVIKAEHTGGLALAFGHKDSILRLVHQIGRGEGLGRLLGRGSRTLAEEYGVPDEAVCVKRLEVPMHDPRAFHGMGLAYATSVRGACHVSGVTLAVEQGGSYYPGLSLREVYEGPTADGKPEMVAITQDFGMVLGSAAIFCELAAMPLDETDIIDALSAATGRNLDVEDVLSIGRRIWLAKRMVGYIRGMRRQDDRLPVPCLTPLDDGPNAGNVPDIDGMLSEFYSIRGLLPDGRPSNDTLESSGLMGLFARYI